MDLTYYQPEVVADKLRRLLRHYYVGIATQKKLSKEQDILKDQKFIYWRKLNKPAQDAKALAAIDKEVIEYTQKIIRLDVIIARCRASLESFQEEIDSTKYMNSVVKEELKLAQINERTIADVKV
jgi:hypothetical protein